MPEKMSPAALFDTHAHFDNRETAADILQRARESGVGAICAATGHLEAVKIAADLAHAHDNVVFTTGLHPHDSAKADENPLPAFDAFHTDPKCVAVGEIGLDYFYDFSTPPLQRACFEHFLEKALEWDLPAVVHCRDRDDHGPAYDDALSMLRDFARDRGRFVMHCFAGSPAVADAVLALGGYLGVTGMVTFKMAENIREIVKIIPDDRLLIETDSPYLAPVPHRGKPNESLFLPLVAHKVAEVRRITFEQCAALTTKNAFEFFRIALKSNGIEK